MRPRESLSKAIYELRLALRAARRTCGLKADLYYIIASLMSRPVTLSVAGHRVTMSKDSVAFLVVALASAARCPYVNGDYLDFELNYFGRTQYTLGFPLSLASKYGVYLGDDALPRPSLNDCRLMSIKCPYYVGDLTGAEVLDVGGYIGDSALYFYALGAKHVKVYEPFFHEVARRNLRVNGLPDDVEPYAVGDGSRMCTQGLGPLSATVATSEKSGPDAVCADGRSWQEALDRDYDLVKVDCEGCEKYLQDVPCEYIRRGRAWVLEVHRPIVDPGALANKFSSCGFSATIRERGIPLLYALRS